MCVVLVIPTTTVVVHFILEYPSPIFEADPITGNTSNDFFLHRHGVCYWLFAGHVIWKKEGQENVPFSLITHLTTDTHPNMCGNIIWASSRL